MTFDAERQQLGLFDATPPDSAWVVRESARARRLTVRVYATGAVEVVVPPRTAESRVQAFVESHREWIETRQRRALANPPRVDPFPPQRLELRALGESWRLHVAGGTGRLKLSVAGPGLLQLTGASGHPSQVKRLLRRWVMERCGAFFELQLSHVSRDTGLVFTKLAIRRQRTRWGSCSSRGTISVNACLAFQSSDVVRYLFVHELAHTRHMNHSRRFWALVAEHCADFRQLDRELEEGWRNVPSWMLRD